MAAWPAHPAPPWPAHPAPPCGFLPWIDHALVSLQGSHAFSFSQFWLVLVNVTCVCTLCPSVPVCFVIKAWSLWTLSLLLLKLHCDKYDI